MKAQALIGPAVTALRNAGIDMPEKDARRLLAYAMNVAPDRLTLHLHDAIDAQTADLYSQALQERLARRPVAQIIAERMFWGRKFRVTEAVLDPRPETETLIVEALRGGFERVLDLGTGSGCIVLTLLAERPGTEGVGVDLSPEALAVARDNAGTLGLADRVALTVSDWFSAVVGRFDLIVSNPPYIAECEMADLAPEVRNWEPHLALTPGGDGLGAYRSIAMTAPSYLMPGGRLMVEIGPTQAAAVGAMFVDAGFQSIRVLPDLDGRDRVVAGHLPL
jgi:release factor glutamine methyltransferase